MQGSTKLAGLAALVAAGLLAVGCSQQQPAPASAPALTPTPEAAASPAESPAADASPAESPAK